MQQARALLLACGASATWRDPDTCREVLHATTGFTAPSRSHCLRWSAPSFAKRLACDRHRGDGLPAGCSERSRRSLERRPARPNIVDENHHRIALQRSESAGARANCDRAVQCASSLSTAEAMQRLDCTRAFQELHNAESGRLARSGRQQQRMIESALASTCWVRRRWHQDRRNEGWRIDGWRSTDDLGRNGGDRCGERCAEWPSESGHTMKLQRAQRRIKAIYIRAHGRRGAHALRW